MDRKANTKPRNATDTAKGPASKRKTGKQDPKSGKPPPQAADIGGKPRYIVGIGASAGGLRALQAFFQRIPEHNDMAFVIVVHLSPDRESHLAELLQPHCKMPVKQVKKTELIEKEHVYVIPPNANLDSIDTHLRLSRLEKSRIERAPIDHFFDTLAATHHHDAIGVILTGTGNDGTLGLKEIKQWGGLTVVQEPGDAEFDGMPQSAISTGIVDVVAPLARIPDAVMQYATIQPNLDLDDPEEKETVLLYQKLMALIKAHNGRDFNRYKISTIQRRVQRRMQLWQIPDFQAYLDLLNKNKEEIDILSDDLLITVTSFFRDPDVFRYLRKEVIPTFFKGKSADDEIRVWSVGCATGEEAYSLAILFAEESARYGTPPKFQIFASDLHQNSLKRAREGFYPGDIEANVSAVRLKKFFQKESGGYRVNKIIRERVIFAPHNLLSDPPFSRVDLVLCRNLLIYIQRSVQAEIIELFHYALKPGGYMVLGTSETADSNDLFQIKSKKNCIFQKRNVPPREPSLPVFPLMKTHDHVGLRRDDRSNKMIVPARLHQRLAESVSPPSVLISPDDRAIHLSERAGRYLVHPGGEPTDNIFKLVREEMRLQLGTLLKEVRDTGKVLFSDPVSVRFHGESGIVVLRLQPALEPGHEGYVLLAFNEAGTEPVSFSAADPSPGTGSKARSSVTRMEKELHQTRQRMQALVEDYESSQEEMKASNEELQSANEELRSTMEELETSKEELQSMNEELQTVNQENRHKVEELAQLSGDLQNLLAATDIATLFLDRELCIMRYTPKIEEIFNIRGTDRHRPISDLTHCLGYDSLEDDARQVLKKLVPQEREVISNGGNWYLTRIMPYRSTSDHIEGLVITFVDVTSRRRIEDEVWQSMVFAEQIIATMPEPLLVLASDLTVRTANTAFFQQFNVKPGHIEGRKVYEIRDGEWNIPALRKLLEDVLSESHILYGYQVDHEFGELGRRVMLLNARLLQDQHLILLSFHDITSHSDSEKRLQVQGKALSPEANAVNRLRNLVTRLFISGDFHSALKEVLEAVLELTGADAGDILLWNEETGKMDISTQHGFPPDFLDYLLNVTIDDDSSYGKSARTGKRVKIRDVDSGKGCEAQHRAILSAGYKGVQSTPLMSSENRVLGVLSSYFKKPYQPNESDLRILDLYTRQIADCIDQVRFMNS